MARHRVLAGSAGVGVLDAALDLVFPQRCAGCGTAGGLLCAPCEALLGATPAIRPPVPTPPGLPPPWSVAPYSGVVRQLVVAHKERGLSGLTRPLGAALARAALAAAGSSGAHGTPAAPVLLVPVPSSRASVHRRGEDPTLRLAQAAVRAAERHGVTAFCLRALRHRRRVADQAGLSAAARAANLAGALRATRDLRGARVIVVDDVVTTGATLAEAARALITAGAVVPATAVVAATPRDFRRAGQGHERPAPS